MAMTSLFFDRSILEVAALGDATHAHWELGHSSSRLRGQTGRDGLTPDKFDNIPREIHNIAAPHYTDSVLPYSC